MLSSKIAFFLFLELYLIDDIIGQGLKPGNYEIKGTMAVLPDGGIETKVETKPAKSRNAGQVIQPPGIGPTSSTFPSPSPSAGITPSSGSRSSEFTEEENDGLTKHNEFRQTHQVPPMTLDRTMCDKAKAYAEQLAASGTLAHSSPEENDQAGENLSYGCSTSAAQTVEEAVTNWYNEVCDPGYDFNNGGYSSGTAHFTQVVWKGSTKLGIGRAVKEKNGMLCAYIVGRYKPAGNMIGSFPENVLKGSFNKENECKSTPSSKRRYFDKSGKPLVASAPFGAVNVAASTPQASDVNIELLNSKKRKKKHFVHS